MQPPLPAPVATWRNDTYDAISPLRPELSQKGKTIVITGAVSISCLPLLHAACHASLSCNAFLLPQLGHLLQPITLSLPCFQNTSVHTTSSTRLACLTKANDSCLAGQWHWSRDRISLRFCWRCTCCTAGSIRVSASRDCIHRFILLPSDQNVDPCS